MVSDYKSRLKGMASGFTLIEVMLVVSLVGILAAMAGSNYFEVVESGRLVEARKKIDGTVKRARSFALKNNTRVYLLIDNTNTDRQLFIAATGVDADSNGTLDWGDDGNGIPEDNEGEIAEVVSFANVDSVDLVANGVSVLGASTGCITVAALSPCLSSNAQAIFGSDGFLYATSLGLAGAARSVVPARMGIGVMRNTTDGFEQGATVMMIGENGAVNDGF